MPSISYTLLLGALFAHVLPSRAATTTTIPCRQDFDCSVTKYTVGALTVQKNCATTAGSCTGGFCVFTTAAGTGIKCQNGCSGIGDCPARVTDAAAEFLCPATPSPAGAICNANPMVSADTYVDTTDKFVDFSANQPCATQYVCNGTAAVPWCPIPLVTAATTVLGVSIPAIAAGVPIPGFATNATVCRASTDLCDANEVCPGDSYNCPAIDAVLSNTTTCRAAAGTCDIAATCTGSSKVCPANAFKSNTTVCRNSTGVCDPAETCTGVNASCPADAFASATTVCANASGICFNNSLCSGNTSACVAKPVANGTACGNSTNPATCNGAGTCSLTCLAKQTACSKTTPPCCARCDGTKYVCRKNSAGDKLCLACVKTGNKCKKTKDCCTGTCKNGKCA